MAKRVQLHRADHTFLRWLTRDEAICYIAGGCVVLGKRRVIHAIEMPQPPEVRQSAKRSIARDKRRSLPVGQPTTTRAEAYDNPPKVIKHKHIGTRTREIFASSLCGRAGIIADPSERKKMREHLRQASA